MTGTPEQITAKKAARIVSTCRAFFPWYEPQIKDKFERQAWEELKAKVIPEVESYTDASQLIADVSVRSWCRVETSGWDSCAVSRISSSRIRTSDRLDRT